MLRDAYAAFVRGDLDVAFTVMDSEFVLEVHTERADLPESPVYHGRAGFLDNWREVTEPFDEVHVEPEEISGTSERLIVAARMTGRGKASGAPFEIHIFHVWTVHDGMAVRLDIYPSMQEALAAEPDQRDE
jgi:ketosteroid isomerase-like protein